MTEKTTNNDAEKLSSQSAEAEHRFHSYEGSAIPWYVRVLWIGFWVIAAFYVLTYLLPILPKELADPP